MSNTRKLSGGHKHLLRLIAKEQNCPDGWAKVSAAVYPLVEAMPAELVELRQSETGGGIARLTPEGENIINAMAYLGDTP